MWTRLGKVSTCVAHVYDIIYGFKSKDLESKNDYSDDDFVAQMNEVMYGLKNIKFAAEQYNKYSSGEPIRSWDIDIIGRILCEVMNILCNDYYKVNKAHLTKDIRIAFKMLVLNILPSELDNFKNGLDRVERINALKKQEPKVQTTNELDKGSNKH